MVVRSVVKCPSPPCDVKGPRKEGMDAVYSLLFSLLLPADFFFRGVRLAAHSLFLLLRVLFFLSFLFSCKTSTPLVSSIEIGTPSFSSFFFSQILFFQRMCPIVEPLPGLKITQKPFPWFFTIRYRVDQG